MQSLKSPSNPSLNIIKPFTHEQDRLVLGDTSTPNSIKHIEDEMQNGIFGLDLPISHPGSQSPFNAAV